jgi:hypothetical protein
MVQANGAGIRLPGAKRRKLRVSAIEAGDMWVEAHYAIQLFEITVALAARRICCFRETGSALVFNMAGTACGYKCLLLIVNRSIVARETILICDGCGVTGCSHVAQSTAVPKYGMCSRQWTTAVKMMRTETAFSDDPPSSNHRQGDREQQPPASKRTQLSEILQVDTLGYRFGGADARHG